MTSTMPGISLFIKNGFFHFKNMEVSSRVRSSSVPPDFRPAAFPTKVPDLTTPEASPRQHVAPIHEVDNIEPAQRVKPTPLPFDSQRLQQRKAWADISSDDEASDDELCRTRSDSTKCSSSDSDNSSMHGEAPSIASTCATPCGHSKTPLSAKAAPYQPGCPKAQRPKLQFFPRGDATASTAQN